MFSKNLFYFGSTYKTCNNVKKELNKTVLNASGSMPWPQLLESQEVV